jgi:DNA-binding GntR family transcriptional regulator
MRRWQMSLDRIDRKATSLTALVHHKLREAILSGQLKSGESLVEENLAVELGVSRSPLREALARLEQEGLIISKPYRGAVVAGATRAEIVQAIQLRERLEPLAIELAIDVIPEEEIDEAMAQIETLKSLAPQHDPLAYYECDRALHSLAPRYAGNLILEQFLSTLEDKVHTYRLQRVGFQDILAASNEHIEILGALRRRERDAAAAAMVRHLKLACERLCGVSIRE